MFRNFKDPEYKRWREKVYARDNYTCQWPNCTTKSKLNAHHIKTWAEYPSLRFVSDNGITLCAKHHKLIRGIESYYEAVFLSIVQTNKKKHDK